MLRRLHNTFAIYTRAQNLPTNEMTFNLTNVSELDENNKIILDGRYEDIEEVREYIESRLNEDKFPFLNPATYSPMQAYSTVAINKIKSHPSCKELVEKYEELQRKRAAELDLPQCFYDALHAYLKKLLTLGHSSRLSIVAGWHFDASALNSSFIAKSEFIQQIDENLSDSEKELMSSKMISVPLLLGAPVEEKLVTMMNGSSPYECVILQQVFLWKFLVDHDSQLQIPQEVLTHQDARIYHLSQDHFTWAEQLFRSVPDIFLNNRRPAILRDVSRRNEPLALLAQFVFIGANPIFFIRQFNAPVLSLVFMMMVVRSYLIARRNEVGSLEALVSEYQVSWFAFAKEVAVAICAYLANLLGLFIGVNFIVQMAIDLTNQTENQNLLIVPLIAGEILLPAILNICTDFYFLYQFLVNSLTGQPQADIAAITDVVTEQTDLEESAMAQHITNIPRVTIEDKTPTEPYHPFALTLYQPVFGNSEAAITESVDSMGVYGLRS